MGRNSVAGYRVKVKHVVTRASLIEREREPLRFERGDEKQQQGKTNRTNKHADSSFFFWHAQITQQQQHPGYVIESLIDVGRKGEREKETSAESDDDFGGKDKLMLILFD